MTTKAFVTGGAGEIGEKQAVRGGDVRWGIDDRDYRARLAQAVANVVAAEACELMFLSKDAFQRCLQDNFQVAQKLMTSR